jgi:deoxyribodipyrimidine photo-lyase
MGFEQSAIKFPPKEIREHILEAYARERNFPGKETTTRMGIHLRFGTVSIRQMVKKLSNIVKPGSMNLSGGIFI